MSSPLHHKLDHDASEQMNRRMDEVFMEMDVRGDGHVTKEEFTRFLRKNPRGWPLADLLDGQTTEVKDEIITFWFRKLDIQNEGYIVKAELRAFANLMMRRDYKEQVYTDLLIDMFDTDNDERISRIECKKMLRVLLGHEPTEIQVNRVAGKNGVSRDELKALLHSIQCDFKRLEKRGASGSAETLAVLLIGLGIGLTTGLVLWKFWPKK